MSYSGLGALGAPVDYEDFRTGLTFQAVRDMLSHEQDQERARGQYMFVSRSTVLGRWNQLKREMYERYVESQR